MHDIKISGAAHPNFWMCGQVAHREPSVVRALHSSGSVPAILLLYKNLGQHQMSRLQRAPQAIIRLTAQQSGSNTLTASGFVSSPTRTLAGCHLCCRCTPGSCTPATEREWQPALQTRLRHCDNRQMRDQRQPCAVQRLHSQQLQVCERAPGFRQAATDLSPSLKVGQAPAFIAQVQQHSK